MGDIFSLSHHYDYSSDSLVFNDGSRITAQQMQDQLGINNPFTQQQQSNLNAQQFRQQLLQQQQAFTGYASQQAALNEYNRGVQAQNPKPKLNISSNQIWLDSQIESVRVRL